MPSKPCWPDCDFRQGHTCTLNGDPEQITIKDCAGCQESVFTPPGSRICQRPQTWRTIPPSPREIAWLHHLGIPCRG